MARLVDLALSVPLGLTVLYGTCRFLRVQELDAAQEAVVGRLRDRKNWAEEQNNHYDKIYPDDY